MNLFLLFCAIPIASTYEINEKSASCTSEVSMKNLILGIAIGDEISVADAISKHAGDLDCILSSQYGNEIGIQNITSNISLFHLALGHSKDSKVLQILLENNADPSSHSFDYPPPVLYTILHKLRSEQQLLDVMTFLVSDPKYIDKLRLSESTSEWNNEVGLVHNPPFIHHVMSANMNELALFLINNFNRIFNGEKEWLCHSDLYGVSLLHLSTWLNQPEIVATLLASSSLHCSVVLTDNHGRTPLHYAIIRKNVQIFETLMRKCVDDHLFKSDLYGNENRRAFNCTHQLLDQRDSFGYTIDALVFQKPVSKKIIEIYSELLRILLGTDYIGRQKNKGDKYNVAHFNENKYEHKSPTGWTERTTDTHFNEFLSLDSSYSAVSVESGYDLTLEDFDRKYRCLQRPVLITGNITGGYTGLWRHLEKREFAARYGDIRTYTGIFPYLYLYTNRSEYRRNVTLYDWVSKYMTPDRRDPFAPPSTEQGDSEVFTPIRSRSSGGAGQGSTVNGSCTVGQPTELSRLNQDSLEDYLYRYNAGADYAQCDNGTAAPDESFTGDGFDTTVKKERGCSLGGKEEEEEEGAWIAFENTVQAQSALFKEDSQLPPLLNVWERDATHVKYQMQLSLGASSSGTPLHGHDAAWNILFTGRKRWILLPPHRMGPRLRFWADPVHPLKRLQEMERWVERNYAYEVIQSPGDVLYIPSDWIHATINIGGETLCIAQEFGVGKPWLSLQPIGMLLYSDL